MQPDTTGGQSFAPYKNEAFNHIYNLLFCDNFRLLRAGENKELSATWAALRAEDANIETLNAIAKDESQESRVRVLAYNRLREKNQPVPAKKLLGVIIEVGLKEGLDVLAAFPDDRVRYINHVEKMSVFEASPPDIQAKIRKLLDASQRAVEKIGPWNKARLAPPGTGTIRITFLVSDGLYLGQGPMDVLQRDAMAGRILAAGTELLQAVVNKTLEASKK
jgi:hypothetical protein